MSAQNRAISTFYMSACSFLLSYSYYRARTFNSSHGLCLHFESLNSYHVLSKCPCGSKDKTYILMFLRSISFRLQNICCMFMNHVLSSLKVVSSSSKKLQHGPPLTDSHPLQILFQPLHGLSTLLNFTSLVVSPHALTNKSFISCCMSSF